jgi:hypothetical protein
MRKQRTNDAENDFIYICMYIYNNVYDICVCPSKNRRVNTRHSQHGVANVGHRISLKKIAHVHSHPFQFFQ